MEAVATFYDGSTILQPLADIIGFELDKVNFVLCLFSSLPIAYVYREHFAAGKVSRQTRTLFPLLIGLMMSYFCFGRAVNHLLTMALVSYALMHLAPSTHVHLLVFGFSMSYLLWVHFYRWLCLTSYCLDVTGPMMIAVQKGRKPEDLSKLQKKEAITEVPSLLDYLSFLLNFQTMMAGPSNSYADYSAFLDGTHVKPNREGKMPDATEPSQRKLMEAMFYFVVVASLGSVYKPEHLLTQEYLDLPLYEWCFWWYVTLLFLRCNYYFTWTFADAVCNMSGFGFSGYTKYGEAQWELCTNVKPLQVETSLNMKETLEVWNIRTVEWLRRVAYDRTPESYRTCATYLLSAVWHGVSVGYYICFSACAVFTLTGAKIRRSVRWRFTKDANSKMAYDLFTCFWSRLAVAYAGLPFVLMDWYPSMFVLSRVFFLGHVLAAFCYFVVPMYFPPQRGPDGVTNTDRSEMSRMSTKTHRNATESNRGAVKTSRSTTDSRRSDVATRLTDAPTQRSEIRKL